MADKTQVTRPSGASGFPSPDQYPESSSDLIFGGPLPTGTGAPGSAGASGSADATNQPGQNSDGLTGVSDHDIVSTGAPGSQGATNSGGGSAITYTQPNDGIGPYVQVTVSDDVSGPRDSTGANDSGYGTGGPQLPSIKGNEPTDTGAGGGSVMRGGRAVRG